MYHTFVVLQFRFINYIRNVIKLSCHGLKRLARILTGNGITLETYSLYWLLLAILNVLKVIIIIINIIIILTFLNNGNYLIKHKDE
jgi:hypothetical protein